MLIDDTYGICFLCVSERVHLYLACLCIISCLGYIGDFVDFLESVEVRKQVLTQSKTSFNVGASPGIYYYYSVLFNSFVNYLCTSKQLMCTSVIKMILETAS